MRKHKPIEVYTVIQRQLVFDVISLTSYIPFFYELHKAFHEMGSLITQEVNFVVDPELDTERGYCVPPEGDYKAYELGLMQEFPSYREYLYTLTHELIHLHQMVVMNEDSTHGVRFERTLKKMAPLVVRKMNELNKVFKGRNP